MQSWRWQTRILLSMRGLASGGAVVDAHPMPNLAQQTGSSSGVTSFAGTTLSVDPHSLSLKSQRRETTQDHSSRNECSL